MINYINHFLNDLFLIITRLKNDSILENDFDFKLVTIDFFSKSKKGDISTNLLLVLKKNIIKKNFDINNFLHEEINKIQYVNEIEIAEAGFINITFNTSFLISNLTNVISNDNNFGVNNHGKNKKINIEYVSANPTGPIHIGHIRGAVYGDVLANILKKNGYKVTREYYVNDSGIQINNLGNSLY